MRKLGRRPPKNAPALRLARILTGTLPKYAPVAADHFSLVSDWDPFGNLDYGTCGPASIGNQRKLVTKYLTGAESAPTLDDVYDLYRRSGNPRFDPATGRGDNGVVLQTMLEALLKDGIGGVKPLAFAQVDHTNLGEVWAAIAIFGSVIFGVDLQTAQQAQTDDKLWDWVRRSGEWGGHAVVAGRYADVTPDTKDRTGAISWAMPIDMTDAFCSHLLEECWAVIWPENVGTRAFVEGIDQAALAEYYTELTGRPFPVVTPTPPPPPPVTPPAADPADVALATAMRGWLADKGL